MNGSELAGIIRERVFRDMFPAPDLPMYTYIHPKWPHIWAELRARRGPVRSVFLIALTLFLWPFQLVWALVRRFFSMPVGAVFATAVLGGVSLWFWSWPGLLVVCLMIWLYIMVRQHQKPRTPKEGESASGVAAPAANSSASESEHEPVQDWEPLIAIAHHRSLFKHIPGQPWGDSDSYELTQVREVFTRHEALEEREAEIREHDEALRKKRERDEAREQEAREFLVREAERVLKEREAAQKRDSE